MEEVKLAFVILHFGDLEMTKKAIKSLNSGDVKIYLVLNGGDENIKEFFESEFPQLKTILLKKNLGFAGGINKGIKSALDEGFDYIFISNNDVIFEEKFSEKTKNIIKELKGEKVCFSPLILDEEEKIWFSSGKFSCISGRAKHKDFGKKVYPKTKIESDYLTGCALCFPKESVEDVGFLDESYYLYWEDVDWSIKLKRKGFQFFVYPELRLIHLGSKSTKLESETYLYYYFRNHLKFLTKNLSYFLLPILAFFFLFNIIKLFSIWFVFYGKDGRKKIKAVYNGIKDFFTNKEGKVLFQ